MEHNEPNPQASESNPMPVSPSETVSGQRMPPNEDALAKRIEARLEIREHTGPLPSPESFRAYAEMIPHGAERLMRMAEKEQDHQHNREKLQEKRATLGVISAFSIVIGAFGVSAYAFFLGYSVEGSALAGVTLASIVGAFIHGTATNAAHKTGDSDSKN